MSKRSKLYKERATSVQENEEKALEAAVETIKAMPQVKFNETVEVAFKLGIDPRKSDQNVRGAVALPNGTGKEVKVAVIAADDAAEAARQAGADFVGYEELLEKIKDGWAEFDSLIATPDAMKDVRPLGRVLGPRGLMPNPKTGTVTNDTAAAVKEAKAGRVEYRADRGACVHVPIGKVSFEKEALIENFNAVVQAILRARPATAKGIYLQSCTICSTMSPGIKLDIRPFARN
jgi:large subunit ribosomal protein L1